MVIIACSLIHVGVTCFKDACSVTVNGEARVQWLPGHLMGVSPPHSREVWWHGKMTISYDYRMAGQQTRRHRCSYRVFKSITIDFLLWKVNTLNSFQWQHWCTFVLFLCPNWVSEIENQFHQQMQTLYKGQNRYLSSSLYTWRVLYVGATIL